MRLVTVTLAAAAAFACAATAFAQPVHINDVQFIEASRCVGLMSSKGVGTADAAALAQYVKAQSNGRVAYVYDRADQARGQGESDGNRSNAANNPRLLAERDGVCHSFLGGAGGDATIHARM